jgi:hypothetical protein
MKAKITLPSGAIVEVEASPEEIRRLAGEPGYRLELLPMVPPAICICGRAYSSIFPPICPVHGQPFSFRPMPLTFGPISNAAAAAPFGGWFGTIGGHA